jgi:hypothetical protein
MPFQAAGLNAEIPWYQVLGNHDHFWLGSLVVNDYLRQSYTNSTVLLMGDLKTGGGINSRTTFMGTVDGSTPEGNIVGAGPVTDFIVDGVTNTPTVAPDANRYSLTRSNWMREFTNTASRPVGHGFSQDNITNDFACYSFVPKSDLPLKVIVLDDTMSDWNYDTTAQGGLDTNQLAWLVQELNQGQTNNQLMVIAAHIPIELLGLSNTVNSVSIRVTDIDLDVTPNSQADISRGYAIGASRIFASPSTSFADTNAYVRNAELVKLLTPHMQTVIAGLGEPLGHRITIYQDQTDADMNIGFLGQLQCTDSLPAPSWNEVSDASNSPYTVSSPSGAKFYRALE